MCSSRSLPRPSVPDVAVSQNAAIDLRADPVRRFSRRHSRPVVNRLRARPAITFRVLEIVGEMRSMDQEFFRHAPAHDAGAADSAGLDNGRALAMASRHPGRANSAGAGANGDEIMVAGRHWFPFDLASRAGGLNAAHAQVFDSDEIIDAAGRSSRPPPSRRRKERSPSKRCLR